MRWPLLLHFCKRGHSAWGRSGVCETPAIGALLAFRDLGLQARGTATILRPSHLTRARIKRAGFACA